MSKALKDVVANRVNLGVRELAVVSDVQDEEVDVK